METIHTIINSYARTLDSDRRHLLDQHRFVHLARKVVGVGSVGTDAWIALFLDRDRSSPLFLQVKEAEASVLERFTTKSVFSNHGHRVVAGQRLMQAASDIFLGWDRVDWAGRSRDYYIRQLRDWKGSADVAGMTRAGMDLWGRMCAWTLARAHARSGDRGLPGNVGRLRPGRRRFLYRIRGPERARLPCAQGRRGKRKGRRRGRCLKSAEVLRRSCSPTECAQRHADAIARTTSQSHPTPSEELGHRAAPAPMGVSRVSRSWGARVSLRSANYEERGT